MHLHLHLRTRFNQLHYTHGHGHGSVDFRLFGWPWRAAYRLHCRIEARGLKGLLVVVVVVGIERVRGAAGWDH